MSSESSFSSPSIIDGKIYFGSRNGYVYCLNLDGREEWKLKAASDNIFATPAVVNDKIFFTSYDSNFYCVSTDGRLLWKFPMGNSSGGSATIVDDHYKEVWRFRRFNNQDPGKISVKAGLAIFGSWDNHLYALDIDDGRKVWSYITGGLIASSPPIVDRRAYFGAYDNNIYCVDIVDGSLVWKVRTGGQISSSPVVDKGMLYLGSYDQNIYSLSLTGEKIMVHTHRRDNRCIADCRK
jgi:outer membrane protein assembly factor BamB